MSKRANGLRSMAVQMGDTPLRGWTEGLVAAELTAAAMPAASSGLGAYARDRALAGARKRL